MLIATVWDDGLVSDFRLMDILDRYGATASFALSPGVYQEEISPNDHRGGYGMRVAKRDLLRYGKYDVVSHGYCHVRLDTLPYEQMRNELLHSKARLEDTFERPITGLAYPGGYYNRLVQETAEETGYHYARANTPNPGHFDDQWAVRPVSWKNWKPAYETRACALIMGHTYELRTKADWTRIETLYRKWTTTPGVQLVSMTALAQELGWSTKPAAVCLEGGR